VARRDWEGWEDFERDKAVLVYSRTLRGVPGLGLVLPALVYTSLGTGLGRFCENDL
jgi:hypothetical protein